MLILALLALVLPTSDALAQSEADTTATELSSARESEIPYWAGAIFLGAITELEYGAGIDGTHPYLGFEVEYRFAPKWGVSAMVEIVLSEQSVREAVILVMGQWHVNEALRLMAGPGLEFDRVERTGKPESWLVRIGGDWEFPLNKAGLAIVPGFYADFIENDKLALVYGVSLGKRF